MTAPTDRRAFTTLLLEHDVAQRTDRTGPSDPDTHARLFAAVYDDLRRVARGLLRNERPGHTLRPTGLVHEAWIRLVDRDRVGWQSRAHFFGVAARAMRQILVDHAREKASLKRGGHLTRVTLDEGIRAGMPPECEILDLHAGLEKLAERDPRLAQVVEYRVFAGMTVDEVAHVLGVSPRTVHDDWKFARLWLARELAAGG